jgi:hypothetical protein
MIKLTGQSSIKEEFIAKGLQRSKRFSWKQMAVKNLSLYKEVLSSHSIEARYGTKMLFI